MRDPAELVGITRRQELVFGLRPALVEQPGARSVAYTSFAVSSADDTSTTSSPITTWISPESIG